MGYEGMLLVNMDRFPSTRDQCTAFCQRALTALNRAARVPHIFTEGLAVYLDHSSALRIIIAGKHQAHVLAYDVSGVAPDFTTQIKLLKRAADELGYRLVKKPKKRTKTKESP